MPEIATEAVAETCPNCNGRLGVPRPNFCPSCGQETTLRPPRLGEFLQQFGGAYFATEGALWRTLRLLLARPGELTRQYLAGRRKHYVLPLRLYLSISVVVLLAMRVVSGIEMKVHPDAVLQDVPTTLQMSLGLGKVGLREGVFYCEGLPDWACTRLKERLSFDPKTVIGWGDRFVSQLGAAMFVLLPAFALWLQLAYRNRGLRYTEHLVFSLHVHAFWFTMFGLALLPLTWVVAPALLAVPVYTVAGAALRVRRALVAHAGARRHRRHAVRPDDGLRDGGAGALGLAGLSLSALRTGGHNRRPMNDDTPPRATRIRSFVTRAGRMGSGQVRALEELGPRFVLPFAQARLDPAAVFGRQAPLVLEIGFGMGDATAQIAAALPGTDFLGVEVHVPGVGALLKQIGERGLGNLRLVQHDAVEVLAHMIAPASLAGVHVFFPDPWHKKRHHKRRLIQPAFVAQLVTYLQPGGYLHCATDWEPYAQQMLEVMSAEPGLVNTAAGFAPRPDYRPLTKFENRGLKLGHGVWDLVFSRPR